MKSYETWYEFKRDLQARVGHGIYPSEWLRVKPKKALPWNAATMNSIVLSYIVKNDVKI